jgi:hypothetical protein
MAQSAQPTKLNTLQQHALSLFDRAFTEKQEQEIRQMLSDYFARLAEEQVDKAMIRKNITQKDLDTRLKAHRRTPYRPTK